MFSLKQFRGTTAMIWLCFFALTLVSAVEGNADDFVENRGGYVFTYHDYNDLLFAKKDNSCYFVNFTDLLDDQTRDREAEDNFIKIVENGSGRLSAESAELTVYNSTLEEVRKTFKDILADFECYGMDIYVLDKPSCPKGWTQFDESCYVLLSESGVSWTSAKIMCETIGGMLVEIGSQAENEFVRKMAWNRSHDQTVWLGLSDLYDEGHFKWVSTNERPTYTHFYEAPDNIHGTEGGQDCVIMYANSGKWNDYYCERYENTRKPAPLCEDDIYKRESDESSNLIIG